jgi:predicted ATPase/class 3 adenylate cyclase
MATSTPPSIVGQDLLTFLFTDVEGSTRLWEQQPDAMKQALERHDAIIEDAVAATGGHIVKTTGDGFMAVFDGPAAGVEAALDAQQRLAHETWPGTGPLRVRMALHSGPADERGGDYFGPTVNRVARIMAAGHGGQVLLSGAVARSLVGRLPPEASVQDLGEHRLKDLERPESLFQLAHPDLVAEFPPLVTLTRRPNNLPTQTSGFVGRERELTELGDLIRDGSTRLITLTGPGGTGKTRLALRAAAEAIDRFDDGVFFVDLASATDVDAVVRLVASSVGFAGTRDGVLLDGLTRYLADRRMLLVLDNFEQVVEAGPVLIDLLNDCSRIKVLVTSREALRLSGEHLFGVHPLSLPRRVGSVDELTRFEAIQLFVERARAVQPEFRLTDENAAAVVDICRRLDGLPLAIELATARLNLFTPDALRRRLESRLRLGGAARDLPARQQTLRATIDWSYKLLEPGEQHLLEILSVFSGATFEAVDAVTGELPSVGQIAIDPIDGLASLLDKSLIRRVDDATTERVVMLETIREFAAERLADQSDLAAAVRRAHAEWFAGWASRRWEALSPSGRDAVRTGLAAELENLRTAWVYLLAEGDLGRLTQLVDGLWLMYEANGWYRELIELGESLLRVIGAAPSTPELRQQEIVVRAGIARGILATRGYGPETHAAYDAVLALIDGAPDVRLDYPILRAVASFYQLRGDSEKALEIGRQILRLAEDKNDPAMLVDGNLVVGGIIGFRNELETGLGHLDRAIDLAAARGLRPTRFRAGNDPAVAAFTTSAFFLWLLGFPDRAAERMERAVDEARRIEHPYSVAYALFHGGFLHIWRREPAISRERALAVLEVAEEHDFEIWQVLGSVLLGAARTALGDSEGLGLVNDGVSRYRSMSTPPVFWPMLRSLQARALLFTGRADEALAVLDDALALATSRSELTMAPEFLILRGDLLAATQAEQDTPHADQHMAQAEDSPESWYRQAYELTLQLGQRLPQLRAAQRLLTLALRAGNDVELERRAADLRTTYGTFTEGFDTDDLREARDLLSTLPG